MYLPQYMQGISNKLLVVIGGGSSGRAAARLGAQLGARVRLVDRDANIKENPAIQQLQGRNIEVRCGEHSSNDFKDADTIVLSPGIPKKALQELMPRDIPVISELELSCRCLKQEKVIAVTGTNGKTTTVNLIGHILRDQGFKIFLGGNIGTPLSEYLLSEEEAEILVLEVSSFQLMHTQSLHPDVAVLLNFSANHLDYHQDMQEYLQAKLKLFQLQDQGDTAVIAQDLKNRIQDLAKISPRIIFYGNENRFPESSLLGLHNQENLEAAYQVCAILGIKEEDAARAIKTYQPMPHRLEPVAQFRGVLFVDDSKATTIDALRAALSSFSCPVLLLAGGRFKGGNPEEVNDLIKQRVKLIGLFGEGREILEPIWREITEIVWEPTLEKACSRIFPRAEPGDVVLLSPATSSFDLFADYKERGSAFKKAVFNFGKNA